MTWEILKLLLQALISVGAAFLAAWMATRRFRDEKWWEKKVTAYGELVDALHRMKWPASENIDAVIENRDVSDEDNEILWQEFKQARRNVWRIAESSSFLISSEVLSAVQTMEQALSSARNAQSWFDHLNEQYGAVNTCVNKIKEIGAKELGIRNA